MARNRSASAVLDSSVRRPARPVPPRSSPLRRRIVVGTLVVLALVLITISFRASSNGGLHGVENVTTTIMRPFEIGADRVAQPFRDAYDYVAGLVDAKSQLARARAELAQAQQALIAGQTALQDNAQLKALLNYRDGPSFPKDYRAVFTRVVSRPGPFDQAIVVAAGSSSGLSDNDPVVNQNGLIGTVVNVYSNEAKVRLLTDPQSAAGALDVQTQAYGEVQPGSGGTLAFNQVPKADIVRPGDTIVTAGSRSLQFPDIYPKGILIGKVTSQNELDTAIFQQIQVQPAVSFGSLDSVAVLVPTAKQPLR